MSALPESQAPLVSDASLLERVAQRDSTALIELERRHRASLYAQVYGVLWDSARTERVVADVFAQIWQAANRLVGKHSAWSWMRKAATQLALEERAKHPPSLVRR